MQRNSKDFLFRSYGCDLKKKSLAQFLRSSRLMEDMFLLLPFSFSYCKKRDVIYVI